MTAVTMRKVPADVHHLTEMDHLPSVRHLRVQVVTNSKGYVELNLNNRGLRIVPPETFQLINTQVLRLDQNYVDYLPTMIAYLRGLRVLDLQRNVLVHLPETLVNCKHLAELRLTGNRLASLPRSFGGLKNLRILELGENQLEQLPHEVGLLHSLRTLDLHSNRLWHLPFSLQELRHLLNFNLSDNMFDHVPLVVTKITSIRALNLSRNRLGSLPLDLDALKGLRELNMSHNKMASVSSVLVTLTHLKYLSLAHNGLKFLPSRMSQLQNLRVLHLQGNELRHVPSCLRRLRFYNVSSNKIIAFSVEGMRALVSITASKNRLETVPRGLYKLKHLKFLSLDCNALVEIGEEVGNLKQLKALNLAHNNLQGLPKALHGLPLLQNFNIKGNYSLTKRKSQKMKENENAKMKNEKHKAYNKIMNDSGKKTLLSRRGALEFNEDENEEKDDGDRFDDDDVDDDDDDDDEGIWMNEDFRKSKNQHNDALSWTYHSKNRANVHRDNSGPNLISRSAKSLDDLSRAGRQNQNMISHHPMAGELAGRPVERKRRHKSDKKITSTSRSQEPSRVFLGRGLALPSQNKQATIKRMTSSNFANQSSNRNSMRNKGKENDLAESRIEKNKSKMFNKSVKSLKELIFGSKVKNKTAEDILPRGYRGDTSMMKTSNSVNLPLEYTADEVDGDWGRVKGSRTNSENNSFRNHGIALKGVGNFEESRSLDTDGGEVTRHNYPIAHDNGESDVRDWKSVSHGYGSWRSRTQMLWEIEESSHGKADQNEVINMADETRMHTDETNRMKNNNKFQNNRAKLHRKKSLSSGTVASDFTYQKFGGKPDQAPSRQSSNASKYRIEKRNNNHHVKCGNDRYSVMSGHGSTPRPSSRSKWLAQWYGPEYESSFTVGSDDDTIVHNRSYDYSVREARASFATETTMGTHNRHNAVHPYRKDVLHSSQPDFNFNNEYHYRPFNQSRPSRKPKHSSTESLNMTGDYPYPDDNYVNYTRSQEFPPFNHKHHYPSIYSHTPSRDRRYFSNSHSEWSDVSYKADPNQNVHPIFDDDDDIDDNLLDNVENGESFPRDLYNTETVDKRSRNINKPGPNTPEYKGEQNGQKGQIKYFSRSKSFHEFDNFLVTNEPEVQSQTKPQSNQVKGKDSSTKDSVAQLDENFALRKKSELPRSKSMTSLSVPQNEDGRLPPFGMALTALPGGYGTLARGTSTVKQNKGRQMNRTDYTLLGVCNQIETMLNKNLLQPVIGFKGSHKFEDKTIEEKSKGIWRIGDSFDQDEVDDDKDDNNDNNDLSRDRNDKVKVIKSTLEYSQPQTFKVTATGGQFMTCEWPEVKVSVPAHSVSKNLQVTIQTLNISLSLLSQAKRLNHFIDNITAIGPVVYFYLTEEQKLNSPVSFTIPAPANIKGNYLSVLTIKRDNSCMPSNSAFRSSKLEASVSAWHFTAKVAVLTQAKCKYKACKSVEMLLQCLGANQL